MDLTQTSCLLTEPHYSENILEINTENKINLILPDDQSSYLQTLSLGIMNRVQVFNVVVLLLLVERRQ